MTGRVVTQTNTNYDLLFLCVHCEQRPLVSPRLKNVFVSPRPILPFNIILKIFFFTDSDSLRSRFYSNGIDISWPTPSVSLSVPSCSLGFSIIILFDTKTCSQLLNSIKPTSNPRRRCVLFSVPCHCVQVT